MNRLLNSKVPNILPLQLHLNELRSQMDQQVLRRGPFDHQISLYQEIQEMECMINGWNRVNVKRPTQFTNLLD